MGHSAAGMEGGEFDQNKAAASLPHSKAAAAQRVRAMNFKCPLCGKPTERDASPDFPFCSERCRLLDLGNWASERYVVSEPVIDEDELETPKEENEPDR